MANQSKNLMNLAIMDMLEVLCTKPIEDESLKYEWDMLKVKKELLVNNLVNLADLLVEHILLDQHFIDFQWASSSTSDFDDNFEGEVEALKLYIER